MWARLFVLMICQLICALAYAHESRPAYLNINEISKNHYDITWKVPTGGLMNSKLSLAFPKFCRVKNAKGGVRFIHTHITKQLLRCQKPLAGDIIKIRGLALNPGISVLVRVKYFSGEAHSALLTHNNVEFKLPEKESIWPVMKSYVSLGIYHIFSGIDHLLFLLCLLFIVKGGKRLVLAITGFTIAHSITLSLAVLEVVRIPSVVVEACIALSILFLAVEISKGSRDTLVYRKPFIISFVFGLLHGFGFADVLMELGLPQTELALGLFSFNLGIEIGQLIFILFAFLVLKCIYALDTYIPQSLRKYSPLVPKVGALIIGCIAAFWFFERIAVLF